MTGSVSTFTDTFGITATTSYDADNRPVKITCSDGTSGQLRRCPSGRLAARMAGEIGYCSQPSRAVLLSWLSSRFVNDESLRRVGLLAWDDVIACPCPQSASVRIRHDQARSDPARQHAAFGMVPAPEPARGMDHDPSRNSTYSPCWRCRSANWLATGLASYGARRAHLGVLPLRKRPAIGATCDQRFGHK